MITTKIHKKYCLFLLLTVLIQHFVFAQVYKKAYNQAEEDYMKGRYFDAAELYKNVFTKLDNSKSKDSSITKRELICKITDCFLQMGDSKMSMYWLHRGVISGCMDSIQASAIITKQQRRIAGDTLMEFIRYGGPECDDCNAGYFRIKKKYRTRVVDTTKAIDTCFFDVHFIKNKNKKYVEKADTLLIRSSKCDVDMIRTLDCRKWPGYSLFKIDSLGSKCVYMSQGVVDITDLPAGLYYLWIDAEDKVERITIHLN
ncbi:MAG TPA: hypothetical protein VK783_15890 [Bacteroidia bacterium]|nr:hypothetical protein [Bacteroidia bacterium]